jgi:hypothetical protein
MQKCIRSWGWFVEFIPRINRKNSWALVTGRICGIRSTEIPPLNRAERVVYPRVKEDDLCRIYSKTKEECKGKISPL